MISIGKKINSSTIQCPDGETLSVTISHGLSQGLYGEVVVIEFTNEERQLHQTWMSEDSYSEARVAKILYAAKHSPEFRKSLEVMPPQYAASDRLATLLDQFDKAFFIEQFGNLDRVDVHQELGTIINFPDGLPTAIEKLARKAGWLSVSKGGGENRIGVRFNYGHAHAYNHRLEDFFERALTNSLKKPDYFFLDLTSVSTVVATFGVKRPVTAIAPEVVSKAVEAAICYPLHQAHDALRRLKAGRDAWSSMKSQELEPHIEPGALDLLQKAFKGEKSRLTAYRWHLRGLPAPYAILKATLEIERAQDYAMINR